MYGSNKRGLPDIPILMFYTQWALLIDSMVLVIWTNFALHYMWYLNILLGYRCLDKICCLHLLIMRIFAIRRKTRKWKPNLNADVNVAIEAAEIVERMSPVFLASSKEIWYPEVVPIMKKSWNSSKCDESNRPRPRTQIHSVSSWHEL